MSIEFKPYVPAKTKMREFSFKAINTSDRFFMLDTLDLKKLEETTHHGTKFNIIEIDEVDIPVIFNKIKDYAQTDTDYIALYGANTTWVKNHLIESIKAIQIQKREWSV